MVTAASNRTWAPSGPLTRKSRMSASTTSSATPAAFARPAA